MKSALVAALSAFAVRWSPADAARLQATPASRVVALIKDLETRIKADGTKEQKSYDKYACWCEETLARKARKISEAKDTIEELDQLMKELKAAIASHGAQIDQLEVDIKANVEAQREAEEVRKKEFMTYTEEKTESEQCIGALEQAIKVLTAGTSGKKGFLETMKEAQLLSIVAQVRGLLKTPVAAKKISDSDFQLVKRFVDQPEDFVRGQVGVMSAAQIANNPFGDYAPQSTQIQGILKGMYDAFAGDLEKDNVEEANMQKAHLDLMATKKMELKTLQLTLEKQTLDKAMKTDEMAKSERLRDDTRAQLEADEDFFDETKGECKVKATEWSERTRLRTMELQGIVTAITILDSPEARKTFETSGSTLLQLAKRSSTGKRLQAYARLRRLANKINSAGLASLAVEIKSSGHFDKVIASIDAMIEVLRQEEQSDIEHRDRCQNAEQKNSADTEDIGKAITKSEKEIKAMEDSAKDLKQKIKDLETEIADTKKSMKDSLGMRNGESDDFKKALETDTNAIALLDQAIVSLARFFAKNKIPLGLAQKGKQNPEYTVDPDKAPETSWSGGNYGGRKGESGGIIAILKMLKEDLQREISVSRSEEAEAQQAFEKNRATSQKMIDTAQDTKVAREQDLAELEGDKATEESALKGSKDDKNAQGDLKTSLTKDCSWVKTHFKTRATKRKAEIDGLTEAKGYLAGVETDDV